MTICQWFMNILLVLDECIHYFLFLFQFQIFSHNFIQHIEKFATFLRNYVSDIEHFSAPSCAICKMSWRFFLFWSKKKTRKICIYLFQEGRKLEHLAKIFTLFITKHNIEFSQANLYALLYHFQNVNNN